MAENNSVPPSGAVPPKPAEATKVQPKKETVRINLPPKPTAAPTIKIPAPAAPMAAKPATMPPPVPATAPASAPASRPVTSAAAPMRPAAPRAPVAPAISGLDKALAVAAAVIGVVALVSVFLLG